MNVKEEVQLAIDMGIESALEFVLLAKLNADGPEDGYWGYFNNKKVWLSRVATGKLSKFETEYADYRCWDKYPNIKHAYLSGMLKDNELLLREVWDVRVNKAFPRDYFTDELCRLKYELKMANHYKDWLATRAGIDDKNPAYLMSLHDDACSEVEKITKKISYLKRKEEVEARGGEIDTSKDFDIPYLKTIPITDFVEVNRAGFFRIRPEDKTPSCKYYKENNTWVDFGGDNQKHDVIDLICVLHGLKFREACLFLYGK